MSDTWLIIIVILVGLLLCVSGEISSRSRSHDRIFAGFHEADPHAPFGVVHQSPPEGSGVMPCCGLGQPADAEEDRQGAESKEGRRR